MSVTIIYIWFLRQHADTSQIKLESQTSTSDRKGPPVAPEYKHIQLNDLEIIATLGIGGFGRVELV